MDKNLDLSINMVSIEAGNRDSLLNALKGLSDIDDEFCNSPDYYGTCWKETVDAGFDSNRDLIFDEIKGIKNDKECAEYFINEWMTNSPYEKHKVNYLLNENNQLIAIGLALVTRLERDNDY